MRLALGTVYHSTSFLPGLGGKGVFFVDILTQRDAYMERARVEPCPICGGEPIMLARLMIEPRSGWVYDVVCTKCKISGVFRFKMHLAVKMWNGMAKRVRAKIEEGRG